MRKPGVASGDVIDAICDATNAALQPHAGGADHFDEGACQAACLQFVADLLNLSDGSLTDSTHPADVSAKATWQLLLDFEEDVRLRCERDSEVRPHVGLLKAKLRELFELDKSDLDFGIYRIMAAKNKPVEELDLAGLGIDPATVGWVGARQEITAIVEAPAREAGEVIVDEGDAHERILAFLDDLKVL